LYIAFLAFDEFVATHDKDALGGAPKVPGETAPDEDAVKVKGIAFKIISDLVEEAGASLDDDDLSTVREKTGEFVLEL
jgi:amyloid beta precursor protein binding protein 1